MIDLADRLILFELGELGIGETLDLFSELVSTGMAWTLQGSYGRTAANLIESGLLTKGGEITETARRLVADAKEAG